MFVKRAFIHLFVSLSLSVNTVHLVNTVSGVSRVDAYAHTATSFTKLTVFTFYVT